MTSHLLDLPSCILNHLACSSEYLEKIPNPRVDSSPSRFFRGEEVREHGAKYLTSSLYSCRCTEVNALTLHEELPLYQHAIERFIC